MSNKRIGILSPFGFDNYGNRLQSYAVGAILNARGYKSRTIVPTKSVVQTILKDRIKLHYSRHGRAAVERYRNFRAFAQELTPYEYVAHTDLVNLESSYEGFIIGSDQIWYPALINRMGDLRCCFLNHISAAKKITLSPSFGISNIPHEMVEVYREGLQTFERISVREDAGASLVRNLTGKEAHVLVDPTMVVGAASWRELADYSKCPKHPYLLLYSLDKLTDNAYRLVGDFASTARLEVVDLMDRNSRWFSLGPREFVALFDKASYVLTNSFHGAVFSIIMRTPFCLTRRESDYMLDMTSRLDTLTDKFECKDRLLGQDVACLPGFDMNWDGITALLGQEVARFEDFLNSELARCGLG